MGVRGTQGSYVVTVSAIVEIWTVQRDDFYLIRYGSARYTTYKVRILLTNICPNGIRTCLQNDQQTDVKKWSMSWVFALRDILSSTAFFVRKQGGLQQLRDHYYSSSNGYRMWIK